MTAKKVATKDEQKLKRLQELMEGKPNPTPGQVRSVLATDAKIHVDYNEARRLTRALLKTRSIVVPQKARSGSLISEAFSPTEYANRELAVANPSSHTVGRARYSVSHG